MNAMKNLGVFIDALDKMAQLPAAEIAENPELKAQIKNVVSAQNIENVLVALLNDLNVQVSNSQRPAPARDNLLMTYARRETARLKDAKGETFKTEIVNFDKLKTAAANALPVADAETEEAFAAAFNTIWADGAIKINTPGDPSLIGSYLDYTPYRANYISFLSIPTLDQMINRPLDLAFKKFPKIKSENKKFVEAAEKYIVNEQIPAVMRDAVFFSVMSPRGSLTVPVAQNGRVWFNAFNDTQFAYGLSSGYNSLTSRYTSTRVGEIHCLGANLFHGVSAFFLCPGFEPLFGIGLNRVPQLVAAAEAWNLYVHVLKILLVRSQVIIEKLEGDMSTDIMLTKMRAQLQRLTATMGVGTTIEQPRGAQLDILNNNIGPGTADIASVFKEFVGVVAGIAPEYFFGGSNANYSMSAFNIASTNENLRARYQIGQMEPLLRFIINTAIHYDKRLSGLGVAENDFEIDFESIYDETEQERAELNAKKTETLIRQREYSELEKAFKHEKLLAEDISFKGLQPDHNADDNEKPVEPGDAPPSADSKLVKPMT